MKATEVQSHFITDEDKIRATEEFLADCYNVNSFSLID